MSKLTPPRAVFVDHSVGRIFGPPHDRAHNQTVLIAALKELAKFNSPMRSATSAAKWEADGSREWDAELRAEMLPGR